ncbi:uncharacterized protein CANTADRAFT_57532 [Suhomyces tanzawaensis NRRL Y-17324]|uniref:Hyphally-regulated cell wall protein N-terminal domain-containing protein n=1 Tax=Suhomyces tanzawaensis NRRL Y-17324 TaxID=984487 RepID=A0A1E4SBP7_9ASCO|nr:uncharacterized protein CANTADRAFT_57532 [Suhomyces tanzawaensis NRRL Y-17324]ODV76923.1 hypothetical protein CANTADRAFT_57532 [Suhomyces tanzawaensis NRRL Y-17324]
MNFASWIAAVLLYVNFALALPVGKRFYQATSPVFSLIAHHQGKEFQYNLVKFNGEDLELGVDEPAFFGRIRANQGYVLNIPFGNSSNGTFSQSQNSSNTTYPLNTNVYVDKAGKLTTTANNTSSRGFGISGSLLTYQNSTKFLACPVIAAGRANRTLRTNTTRLNDTLGYDIYFKGNSSAACPYNLTGYDISLLVQVSATVNYSPETNTNNFKKRESKRFWFF